MKVGTDAMLLGSWVHSGKAASVLDIGTGSGVVALMIAQQSEATIDAIDIHKPSAREAELNFTRSPWAHRLKVYCTSLQDYAAAAGKTYDLIVSNPPYFSKSLKPSSPSRLLARHEKGLSLEELLDCSLRLMHPGSGLCVVLPVDVGRRFTLLAGRKGLYPLRRLQVRPVDSKPHHRVLTEYSFTRHPAIKEEELVIKGPAQGYSDNYLSMTKNFHVFNLKKA